MKFKGFSNAALNLGFVDVRLAYAARLDTVCCTACGFTTEVVFLCECSHVYCGDCLLVLGKSDNDAQPVMAHCGPCQCRVSFMAIRLEQAFISRLQCLCPNCDVIVRLEELKGHLKCCAPLKIQERCTPFTQAPASAGNRNVECVSPTTNDSAASQSQVSAVSREPVGDAVVSMCAPADTSVTAARVSGMISATRRELIDMTSIKMDAVHDRLNAMQEKVDKSKSVISAGGEIRFTYELGLRDCGEDSFGQVRHDAYLTIDDTVFLFRSYDTKHDIYVDVVAVGERHQYSAYEVTISGPDRSHSRTIRLCNVKVGKSTIFERVLNRPTKDWTLIKVELKPE